MNTFFRFHSALKQFAVAIDSQGLERARLETIFSSAEERSVEIIGLFRHKLSREFLKICEKIFKLGSGDQYTAFFRMCSVEELEKNKDKLMSFTDLEQTGQTMTLFQTSEALTKGIEGMDESMTSFGDGSIGKAVNEMKEKVMKVQETFGAETESPGKLLRHCCIVQALFRELEAGETRRMLACKCVKRVTKKQYLRTDAHMQMFLDQLL